MKKIIVILLLILFSEYAIGQDNIKYSFSFDHMALSVKDVDSSVAFYKNVLGLKEITNRTKIEGIRWLTFSDGTELHLISIIKENFTLNKAIHLGLSTPNFNLFIKRLEILKIDYSDWPGKLKSATFHIAECCKQA